MYGEFIEVIRFVVLPLHKIMKNVRVHLTDNNFIGNKYFFTLAYIVFSLIG